MVLAGRLTTEENALVHRLGLTSAVDYKGVCDRKAALALQRSASALLLLTSRNTGEATGKLFEYLAAGRPIIALAAGNEAARIVQETGTGITVDPDDVEAIAHALRKVVTGEIEAEFKPKDIERYMYPAPAQTMEELIEEAIARRRLTSGR